MAYTLSNKCAKNLCKRIVLLQLIIKNVVTCFFGTQCSSNRGSQIFTSSPSPPSSTSTYHQKRGHMFLEQCISATDEANNFKFGVQLGLESSLPRNNFYDQNWRGSGLGEYPNNPTKLGLPIYICNS